MTYIYIGDPSSVSPCPWHSNSPNSPSYHNICSSGECPGYVNGTCSFGGVYNSVRTIHNHDMFICIDDERLKNYRNMKNVSLEYLMGSR